MTKKKRLLFIVPTLQRGGAEYLTVEICNYLQREYEVYLLVLSGKGSIVDRVTLPKDHILFLESPFHVLTFSGVSMHIFWNTLSTLSSLIGEHKIDVVVANLPISHFLLRLSKFIFFYRPFRLLNIHHSQQFKAGQTSRGKKIFDKVNNLLSFMVDNYNIFVSDASYQDSKANFYYPTSKTMIIHNGTYLDRTKVYANPFTTNDDNTYNIVFAGRMVHEKGHIFFLKVLNEIISQQKVTKTINLYLIGDGPKRDEISTFCQTQSLNNVYLLRWQEKEALPHYFAFADLVVIPSISEGFGLIAVEAIFSGATVLASNAGGLNEIFTDGVNGFVFESGNRKMLASRLVSLINEGTRVDREMSIAHTEKEFSFESMINKYQKVINDAT